MALIPKKSLRIVAIGTTACMLWSLGACRDSFDVPVEEEYARDFIKEFGVPDKNHDWTMATRMEATVTKGFASGATSVKIYSNVPGLNDARLMAEADICGADAIVKLNAVKGTNFLYAVAYRGSEIVARGWAQANDGKIVFAADSELSEESPSAAGLSLTKREDVMMQRMSDDDINMLYNSPQYGSYNEMFGVSTSGYTGFFDDFLDETKRPLEAVPELYTIEGIEIDAGENAPTFSLLEARQLFDYYTTDDGVVHDGVFREKEDNIAKYVTNGILGTDIIFQTKEEGEVDLNCIWRGIGWQADYFGYYYYNSEDGSMLHPLALWNDTRKYVLVGGDGDPWLNELSGYSELTQRYRYELDKDGNRINERWDNNKGDTSAWLLDQIHQMERGEAYDKSVHLDDMLRGATIKLPYFGPDGTGPATYTWPKGVRIGFFLFSTYDTPYNNKDGRACRKFFVSNCLNNYYLFNHGYGEPNVWIEDPWDSARLDYGKNRRPYSVHFRYNGRDYLSMADGGNDFDLNDIVFRLSNLERDTKDFTDDVPPVEPQPQSWIIACEDLGNTDDYDFNDIVLEVSYVSGHTEATVTALACGGELSSEIYYDGDYLGEIHLMADVDYGVIAGTGRAPMGANPQSVKITVPADWDINEGIKKFTIRTLNPTTNTPTGQWITAPNTDAGSNLWNVPQMLLLPSDWRWPLERTHITDAYPGFKAWVGDAHYTGWNATRVDSRVFKR